MPDKRSTAISTIALGISALTTMLGAALFYVGAGSAAFDSFLQAHPFDLLAVAIWYSGGAWLLGSVQSASWSVAGLIYGLCLAALVALLAVKAPWWTALKWTFGIGSFVAMWAVLVISEWDDDGGDSPSLLRSGDVLCMLAALTGASLYFEYIQPTDRRLPLTGLVMGIVGTVIASRLIRKKGFTGGLTLAALEYLFEPIESLIANLRPRRIRP